MDNNLEKLIEFTKFTHKFQKVIRTIYAVGEDRDENDAEHSFQLALVGWYIASSQNLNLDIDKIIKYSLVHDLVETYAGDTYFRTTDQKLKNSKQERERQAYERIKNDFPEFPELHKIIEKYESKSDLEAKYVYALDKMIPVLNIYVDNGRSWKRDGVSFEMLKSKDEKIAVSPEITKLWKELVKILEINTDNLFAKVK